VSWSRGSSPRRLVAVSSVVCLFVCWLVVFGWSVRSEEGRLGKREEGKKKRKEGKNKRK
jgi:hypothetical protein